MKTDARSVSLRYLFLSYLVMTCLFSACEADQEPVTQDMANRFGDSTFRKIYQWQDERRAEDITTFLTSDNKLYREAAAMALASVQDPKMIPYLNILLDDSSMRVRRAAAYALGQTYDSAALPVLARAIPREDSVYVRRELIESLGKVLTQESVDVLHTIAPQNDLEKEGLAWAMYRAGIRNVHDPEFIRKALNFLDTVNTYPARLGAAHFLARTPNLNLDKTEADLLDYAANEPAADVRMQLALALGRLSSRRSAEFLTIRLLGDEDYRVRVNALRALGRRSDAKVSDTTWIFESLEDPSVNVQVMAAETLATMDGLDPVFLVQKAVQHDDERVKGLLFKAAVRNGENYPDAVEVIKTEYESSENPYYKAALLDALGPAPVAYDFIVTKIFSDVHGAVSSAGIAALGEMRRREDFPESLKQPMADVLREVMKSGDIGMIYTGSGILSDTTFDFKDRYEDISFLYESRDLLSLPKDNEALQVLNATIAYFEGSDEMPVTTNPFNHPIDWEFVQRIPKDLEVTIKTSKGPVRLRMLVEESPGSVANFLQLAGRGYYDGIAFHRVVPNFVVQGGCPRGDGFGGEDYSIRSELSDLRYGTGSVGMASAGKDTEGTQWFITHSPTPHLDGRYTIFARVTDGMPVVHELEVGDLIETVQIPEF